MEGWWRPLPATTFGGAQVLPPSDEYGGTVSAATAAFPSAVTVRPDKFRDVMKFQRTINIYDGKIGMVAKTVAARAGEPIRASYTLADDDLYVRARVEEKGVPLCSAPLHPQGLHVAWTQPYSCGA